MPENDIVIYGEWTLSKGVFSPTITKEIINKKKSYQKGDVVKFKIVVTNTYDHDIYDVYVSENNDKSKFVVDSAYAVESDHIAKINSIKANESVTLYSEYKITDEKNEIINEAEIIGALSVDSILDTNKIYKAEVKFNVDGTNLNNPNTGDNISKYILILVISLILIILSLVIFKKIRKTK
jgi:LPXTG-motif cell wall-anchored protein